MTINKQIAETGDVNTKNESGFLPLTYASYFGDRDAVFYTLQEGADPNLADSQGLTPLHWAAMRGHLNIMEDLLNFGAMVDAKNSFGETALFLAMKQGHSDIAKFLISKGASLGSVTTYNRSIYSMLENMSEELRHDISVNHLGIAVKSVSDYRRRNSEELNRQLRVAASEGRTADVERHLRDGANINSRSAFSRTALLFAAQNGHFDTVRALLAYRETQINTRDRYNKSAAQYAFEHGYPHISEFIEMARTVRDE